jgi:hypothetical protein
MLIAEVFLWDSVFTWLFFRENNVRINIPSLFVGSNHGPWKWKAAALLVSSFIYNIFIKSKCGGQTRTAGVCLETEDISTYIRDRQGAKYSTVIMWLHTLDHCHVVRRNHI